jgi:hypothetical protein
MNLSPSEPKKNEPTKQEILFAIKRFIIKYSFKIIIEPVTKIKFAVNTKQDIFVILDK